MPRSKRLPQILSDTKRSGLARYIKGENDERALLEGCRVNESRGLHVCQFFAKFLRLTSGGQWVGRPFILSDFQRNEIIMPLYSWERPDGRRRFTSAFIEVTKKFGKTEMCGGLSIYGLVGDGEPSAEVYTAANDRNQAGFVFQAAAEMVKMSPELRRVLKTVRSTKTIMYGTNAWIRALSADVSSSEGLKAHLRIVDEIHAFNSRGRMLFESLRYSGASRRQPLGIIITTAGAEQIGIGWEEYEFSKEVLAGTKHVTDHFAVICEADPEKDDWRKPATWRKANPHIGITIAEDEVAAECKKAIQSPRLRPQFQRYRLNIWVDAKDRPGLSLSDWKACADRSMRLEDLVGVPCCGGLDLSSTTDLTAFVLVFRHAVDPAQYSIWPFLWMPADNVGHRSDEDRLDYRRLAEEGWVTLIPGSRIEYSWIEQEIIRQNNVHTIWRVGYDRHMAGKLWQDLQAEHGIEMIEVPQTMLGMSAASKELDGLLKSHQLSHNGNPIMDAMAAHTTFAVDGNGNLKPMKNDRQRRRRRIDGIVATINALTHAMVMPDELSGPPKSLEDAGFAVI